MQIVSQSALILHSLFPPMPLLSAPPQPKLLCAPTVAGLLPASTAPSAKIVTEIVIEFDVPYTQRLSPELLRELGPIRSREEMNADLAAIAFEALDFLSTRPRRRQ